MNVILTSTALKFSPPSRKKIAERWIDMLSKVRGIDKWALYVGVENECEDDAGLYAGIDFMSVEFVRNDGEKGIHSNHISVWQKAFDHGSSFFAWLEDDTLPAYDFCEYMEALKFQYAKDKSIFCINSYTGNEDTNKIDKVWRKNSLGVWGFGMWRDRAEECLKDYAKSDIQKVKQMGWDVHLNKVSRRGRTTIMPCISRCLNIGVEGIHNSHDNPELNEAKRTWSNNYHLFSNQFVNSFTEIPPLTKDQYVIGYK